MVSSAELEQTWFRKNPSLWSIYYRAIIDDRGACDIYLSGIGAKTYNPGRLDHVPTNPEKARIYGSPNKGTSFHMAPVLRSDRRRGWRYRVGYPIHAHCWMLLDRVIGHDVIMRHLREFTRAVKAFWKGNNSSWFLKLGHPITGEFCRKQGANWLRPQPVELSAHVLEDPRVQRKAHTLGSPLRIAGLQELMVQVTRERNVQENKDVRARSAIENLPLDIAIYMVDMIYESRPYCLERVQDTRNLLEAAQWTLPATYWIGRCNPQLVFEVDELIAVGYAVDWASFCLGLEQLVLSDGWYCNSGLGNRERTLGIMNNIKKIFLGRVKA
ncbi:uncharacterized protein BDW43DRAFT_305390 [Aspergillus alliaceus]|uniref:uncharacterized protein n=1 Tax=Petromyces alliaceus TaxID=209559 RepID=UPI0012A3C2B3|nr:uncharacterized protein BDW43DRAFT_305390 [Aspergillus alliaceus]KAB8239618.1 hypothetical protein BDW43DRAFT_305390 [Aspergillus alliaceus]